MWRLTLYRGKWCAARRGEKGTERVSLRTTDRDEARRRFQDFVASAETAAETVTQILEAWRIEKSHLKAQKTIQFSIKALTPHFGYMKPDQVSRQACRDYTAASMAKGKKAGSIRRELDVLRAALKWHDRNTPAIIEKPPAPPPKDRYLSRGEYEKLVAHAKTPHIWLFMILALSTAARTSALLELTWEQIDFETGLIVLAKGDETNKRRATVPMTKRAKAALQEAYRGRTCDYVIEYNGDRVASVIKAFKRTAVSAGLDDVTPHVLRHTAAVWMAEAGVPMSEISQYLGHSSSKVTETVYARYSPQYLKGAASALE